jgi:hypothetical protein
MERTLQVCLLAGLMALALPKAAAAPVEGTWEGKTARGQKSMTLQVRERDGKLEGSVVFYVFDKKMDDPEAKVVGQEERPLTDVRWDGKMLRFSVPHEGTDAPITGFEMVVTGTGSAELNRLGQDGKPELTLKMVRHASALLL